MPISAKDLGALAYPRDVRTLARPDMIVQGHVIGAFAPSVPPLTAANTIACIGSCFAQELAKSLSAKGRNVLPIFISERWNTTFALRHFLDLAMDGTPIPSRFVPSGVKTDEVVASASNLRNADAFILTFGLSVCWYEKASGRMVLDIPDGHTVKGLITGFESHEMRQTTVEENVEQISGAIECIRRHKPNAPITLTLSPIPLFVSLTSYPVVTSNQISKSVLRAALHVIYERKIENLTYWPSYEIVEYMAKYHGPIFGQGDDDLRHIKRSLIDDIMELFNARYFKPQPP